MDENHVRKVLSSSDSALGKWTGRAETEQLPLHLRPVLGYCRYSTAGQNEATIDKQMEYISTYCEQKGYRSPRFFSDRARTGENDNRPAWQQLRGLIRPGTIVVVHESTRFGREAFTFLSMLRQVHSAGGIVELVNSSTNDTMYLTIMAAVAEYDYRSVASRLRDGRMQAVAKGKPYRKPPYGYGKAEKEFVINEVEAIWVREMFRMRLEGATIGEIVRYLTANKAPTRTGGKWSVGRVTQVLYSPLYAGYLVEKRPVFKWEK